ncbi:MAG: hypothetical protein JST43_03745 [Bacteroidetes bacterium]|nr:hypothetical protein [Bacteroidota bacterium]MBS1541059.1 hypothetical protein [Bacteroidota bacterium]
MKNTGNVLSNRLQTIAIFLFAAYASFLALTFLIYQEEPLPLVAGYECLIGDEAVDQATHIEVIRHCQPKARSLYRPLPNTLVKNISSLQILLRVLARITKPQLFAHYTQGDQLILLRIFKI